MIHEESLDNRTVHAERRSDYVSPEHIASHWGVHVNTVYRDIRKGALPYFRLPSGRYRIHRRDADRYGKPNV